MLIGRDLNTATSKTDIAAVPCRALNKVDPSLQPFCVSLVDPERPGWFMNHYMNNGYLFLEPEYAPRNSETFDADTSFFIKRNHFFQGLTAIESYSLPKHYLRVTTEDEFVLEKYDNTEEFRNSASMYGMFRDRIGESYIMSCHIVVLKGQPSQS